VGKRRGFNAEDAEGAEKKKGKGKGKRKERQGEEQVEKEGVGAERRPTKHEMKSTDVADDIGGTAELEFGGWRAISDGDAG
jgi:hypothetical protein